MEEVTVTPFTLNFNVFGNFTMSIDAMNKINKIILKDQERQQKQSIKKNKLLKKLIKEHKQLNKPKTIIEI